MAEKHVGAVARIAQRRYWREPEARVMVEAWQRSGESLSGFAKRHGVDRRRLRRWATRMAEEDSARRDPEVSFHPVRLVEAERGAERRGGDRIEVVLGDGRRVRVPRGFAPEDLREVLRVLEGADS